MAEDTAPVNVLIASYLEPDLVDLIREVDERIRVVYEPLLLPRPRYAADHVGEPFERDPADEQRWRNALGEADVLFDFDHTHRDDLPDLAPQVRWIQATSAGIGQLVKRYGYDARMPETVFTTASGVHARPLAEFCVMSMLAFSRGLRRMIDDQARKHWERFAGTDLAGRTLVIVGMGSIGREVARMARAFGMSVHGVKRIVADARAESLHLDALHARDDLHAVLPNVEFLVLAAPHTPETEGMIGRAELALLPPGAVVINVGRGALIDEDAMVEALRTGQLGGASLDVFREEPLPPESPLWDMPNVLVSPHSASTSDRENTRIVELFCDNLRRYLDGKPLRNVLDVGRMY